MGEQPDKELDALSKMISLLKPLEHEDRRRVFAASLVMLGLVDVDYVLSAWQERERDDGE